MIFAGSELLRAHLDVALRAHLRALSRNGVRPSAELLEFAAALSSGAASSAQERPLRASGAGAGEAVRVGADSASASADLLIARDAAHRLSVSVSTLRRWAKAGVIEPVRIGRTVRYRVADLDKIGKA